MFLSYAYLPRHDRRLTSVFDISVKPSADAVVKVNKTKLVYILQWLFATCFYTRSLIAVLYRKTLVVLDEIRFRIFYISAELILNQSTYVSSLLIFFK